jgi:hypothetical protein
VGVFARGLSLLRLGVVGVGGDGVSRRFWRHVAVNAVWVTREPGWKVRGDGDYAGPCDWAFRGCFAGEGSDAAGRHTV